MKLFLVKRTDYVGYDEYDAFVCAAESEEQARKMLPFDEELVREETEENISSLIIWEWTKDLNKIEVEYIGEADEKYTKPAVILASFCAG